MALIGDVTVAQDGGQGNVKLHPYLITLVRWCVSCLWSTATVLLHRLTIAPLLPITGPKPPHPRARPPKRAAGTEHLDPEPRVTCQVLHRPQTHGLDVIFVHGLYGSLGNTWRQGDWRQKYTTDPKKVVLRDHSKNKTCHCQKSPVTPVNVTDNENNHSQNNENGNNHSGNNDNGNSHNQNNESLNYEYINITDIKTSVTFKNLKENLFKNIKPNKNDLITEQFYNNTLLDQIEIIDNNETQAQFVRELFDKENNCDSTCETEYNKKNNLTYNHNQNNDYDESLNNNGFRYNHNNDNKYTINDKIRKFNDNHESKYFNEKISAFNGGDVYDSAISDGDENSECKCGVGEKKCEVGCGCVCDECYSACWPRDWIKEDFPDARVISINYTSDPYLWRPLWIKENKRLSLQERANQMMDQLIALGVGSKPIVWVGHSKGGLFIKQIYCDAYDAHLQLNRTKIPHTAEQNSIDNENNETNNRINDNVPYNGNNHFNDTDNLNETDNDLTDSELVNETSKSIKNELLKEVVTEKFEQSSSIEARASIWRSSAGFMLYSVPHRGSPLADIKTPLTARSVELIEIAKDCPRLAALQARWEAAARAARPAVRALVETRRTLMSLLWLRIVSVHSADAGVGVLYGVSVDHREICKPSSRDCLLYTELVALIRDALGECRC